VSARVAAADVGSTRRRVLDAAIRCIVDEGVYRASSNRIAERAGVTWGVIQHHFGTRDALLMAVVEDQVEQLVSSIEQAHIGGVSTEERIESLADVVWSHYARPEFLAAVQVVTNLSRDPRTAEPTLDALDAVGARMMQSWQHLVDQVVPPSRQSPGLASALFTILRGVAVGDGLVGAMRSGRARRTDGRTRDILVRALTLLVDDTSRDPA
jgi:AcrR family transcriptional regulator